jgi:regulatory factor X
MSFSYDMDLNAPQQEQNHDDSGIGLMDDGIDASFASKMQQSLKSHLSQGPIPPLAQGVR